MWLICSNICGASQMSEPESLVGQVTSKSHDLASFSVPGQWRSKLKRHAEVIRTADSWLENRCAEPEISQTTETHMRIPAVLRDAPGTGITGWRSEEFRFCLQVFKSFSSCHLKRKSQPQACNGVYWGGWIHLKSVLCVCHSVISSSFLQGTCRNIPKLGLSGGTVESKVWHQRQR